jgi:NADH-quinone oxidoreductase subunit E
VDAEFERILAEYGSGKGNLIPLLQQTQSLFGYLPMESMREIARATGKSPAEVYGVATFYAQFRFQPVGRHCLKVCHGTACHVAGADALDTSLSRELGVEAGQTTADREFTVENVACLGCCSLAPVVMLDEEVHGRLSGDKLVKILRKVKAS